MGESGEDNQDFIDSNINNFFALGSDMIDDESRFEWVDEMPAEMPTEMPAEMPAESPQPSEQPSEPRAKRAASSQAREGVATRT